MKNSFLFLLISAAVVLAASCEIKPSVLNYVLDGDLEYAGETSMTNYNDSTCNAAYIAFDGNCYMLSDYTEYGLNRGWTLSFKHNMLTADGELTPFCSAGASAGALKSDVYAVFYDGDSVLDYNDIMFTCTNVITYSCVAGGFMINNTGLVVDYIEGGAALNEGEYMKVVVTAYREKAVAGTAEKYLIDYTGAEAKVITDWEAFTFDIKDPVDAIDFEIETNIAGLPKFFCLDNFVATINVEY